jgi:hypothetical protein
MHVHVYAACPCLHFAGQDRQGRQDYQDRTARKITARINNQKKDRQKRTAMIARTGQPEQDRRNRQAKWDRLNRTGKALQAEHNKQNWTGRTRLT